MYAGVSLMYYIYSELNCLLIIIKIHDSKSRGQEEAQQTELCIRNTTLKLANSLAKLPFELSLSYYQPTMFLLYRINKSKMEEIVTILPKYQPLQCC